MNEEGNEQKWKHYTFIPGNGTKVGCDITCENDHTHRDTSTIYNQWRNGMPVFSFLRNNKSYQKQDGQYLCRQ